MTNVYFTIDTEYSAKLYGELGPSSRQENFKRSIGCSTKAGAVGIDYQMDIFDRHGLKAVFFVDPMPALVWGVEAITDIVQPIIERDHDVQLHIHCEWLEYAGIANPLRSTTGRNIGDFRLDDQMVLLDYAMTTLMAAGAPRPVAFRAGNYGANDDTLRALSAIGIRYDTSHCPGIANSECAISLRSGDRNPMEYCGTAEIPIGAIAGWNASVRHAQLTALSAREIRAALLFAQSSGSAPFTLVSHSFELLSRNRLTINRIVKHRFERICADIEAMAGVSTATYADHPPELGKFPNPGLLLPLNIVRKGLRIAEQGVSNLLYGGE